MSSSRLFGIFLFLSLSNVSFAQDANFYSLGAGFNRYGFTFDAGFHKANTEKRIQFGDWRIGVGNVQHPREVALINNALQSSGVYKFGKVNYCWALRPYYQVSAPLFHRLDKKSVAVNIIGGAGIPVAYLWPVYVRYFQSGTGGAADAYAEVRYDPEIHQQSEIGGRAPFTKGIGDGKVIPGFGINSALEFIWGNYSSDLRILTFGARIESFSKPLSILYKDELNKRTYFMFYCNFAFSIGNI